MPTKNCCAAFPIVGPDLHTTDRKICYDLNTLQRQEGPYTSAYCAGESANLFVTIGIIALSLN